MQPKPLTEAEEAKLLVAYLRINNYRFTHIPMETGGSREAFRRAVRMKQQGASRGFPDYLIIVNKQLIAIELKRTKGSNVTPEQREWLNALAEAHVPSAICHGWEEAKEFVESFR